MAAGPLGPVGGRAAPRAPGARRVRLLHRRIPAVAPGGLDERLRTAPSWLGTSERHLGVPLHADHELVASGASTASMTPSGAQATGPQALAEPVDRLMVEGVDLDLGRADDLARGGCRGRSAPRGWRSRPGSALAVRDLATAPGGAGAGVPPRATFSACMPRQIASTGISRRVGPARDRELDEVELGPGRPEARARRRSRRSWVEVGPAREADARRAGRAAGRSRRARAAASPRAPRPRSSIVRM